jgi:hypothetical protein
MASSSRIHWFTSQGMCDIVTPPFCDITSQNGGFFVETNIAKKYGYTVCLACRSLLQKCVKINNCIFVALELKQTAELCSSKDDLKDTNAGTLKFLIVLRFTQLILAS